MTISFPGIVETKYVKYESKLAEQGTYHYINDNGVKINFDTFEGVVEHFGSQGWWYSEPTGYNVFIFQRFEPKLVDVPATI
jgi:hypothetical protein